MEVNNFVASDTISQWQYLMYKILNMQNQNMKYSSHDFYINFHFIPSIHVAFLLDKYL